VQNVFPFDAQGKPLTGIRLYTESGIPLEMMPAECASQYGNEVPSNVFPQRTVFGDGTDPESCQQSDKPTFKVLPPLAGSTTAPTPTTPTGTGGPTTPKPEVTQR
jgi:hypothetical protein